MFSLNVRIYVGVPKGADVARNRAAGNGIARDGTRPVWEAGCGESIRRHWLCPRRRLVVDNRTNEVLRLSRLIMFRANVVPLPVSDEGRCLPLPAALVALGIPVPEFKVVSAAFHIMRPLQKHNRLIFSPLRAFQFYAEWLAGGVLPSRSLALHKSFRRSARQAY